MTERYAWLYHEGGSCGRAGRRPHRGVLGDGPSVLPHGPARTLGSREAPEHRTALSNRGARNVRTEAGDVHTFYRRIPEISLFH